jgi:hypothetical protein
MQDKEAVTGQGMVLNDRLGRVMLEALKKEPATATERWQALIRMGQIAEAYRYSSDEMVEAIFGSVSDLLNHDRKDDAIRNVIFGDGAH